jgi:hypothetical protein
MLKKLLRPALLAGLTLLLGVNFQATCFAQATNGSITATVVDAQDSAVPNAKVVLKNSAIQFVLESQTDTQGRFVFTSLPPGDYEITIEAKGFKKLDQRNVVLNVNERLTMGNIKLDVGSTTEVVQVEAAAVTLQTESAERSNFLVAKQMENIAVNGRSYLALAGLTAGVLNNGNFTVAGTAGLGAISANGARYNQNQLMLNGISNVDTGNNGDQLATISLDSVQEFRILTGSYQAEYGRSAGAQIIVQTRSGTKDFHGSGYYYRRHDSLNANTWLRNNVVNRTLVGNTFTDVVGLPRQLYRYQNPGYTIGGPIYIPKVMNGTREKLFFFWSQEFQRQLQPEAPRRITVPTALERQGNFSQSLNNQGLPLGAIRDPLTGQPFPGAIIPANRIFRPGQALMNIFPLPNQAQSVTLNYNYESQISTRRPRREDLIRIDYNATDKLRVWGHFINNNNIFTSPYGSFVLGSNVGILPINDGRPGKSLGLGATYIISPKMTAEFTFGRGRNDILIEPADGSNALSRATTGATLPLLYPGAVQRDFIPAFTFNGTRLANSPTLGTGNAPFVNFNETRDFVGNVTRVMGQHTLKFGTYVQRSWKDQTSFANANGNYNFGDNPANPLDTNFGYSNALLGVYNSFQQARAYANGQYRYYNVEFYAQDTYKVNRRLTLDYGIRFAWIQPQHDASLIVSSFRPDRFDPAQAVRLYDPQRNAAGAVIGAIDSATGQVISAVNVGRLVPNSGNFLNGIVIPGKDTNRYLMRDRGLHYGPRFGLAFDVLGNQRMILRTGGGIYYDRFQGNRVFDLLTNPPTVLQPVLNFGFAQDINPATALIGPPGLVMADPTGVVPTTYNINFGLQSKLPWNIVLDTSYVGSMGRHLQNNRNINPVPYGALFRNPTAFNADFLRQYRGYGNINVYEGTVTSNFNSFQVVASRRLNAFFAEMNYTFAKALGTNTGDGDFIRIDSLQRFANYSYLDFHRKHNLNVNFVYSVPSLSKAMGSTSRAWNAVTGGWQLSGIFTYITGSPQGVGFSVPGIANQNLTGSFTEGARIQLVGDPTRGVTGGPFNFLNPDAFRPPQVGSIGVEASPRFVFLPAINNWNISLQKAFGFNEGKQQLQFRVDTFNTFNHTQFSDFNRTVNFRSLSDPTPTNFTRAIGGFGAANGVRDPRILQLMVRYQF